MPDGPPINPNKLWTSPEHPQTVLAKDIEISNRFRTKVDAKLETYRSINELKAFQNAQESQYRNISLCLATWVDWPEYKNEASIEHAILKQSWDNLADNIAQDKRSIK